MVLALLKGLAFGSPRAKAPNDSVHRSSGRGTRSNSTDTMVDSDIESLSSAKHTGGSTRRSRIDPRIISDATIGLSDGLTVPFALTAGLSALGNTKVVIYGGFAELIAGAISMGLGGYLGAKSEEASYRETRTQTEAQIESDPPAVRADIRDVFEPYALPTPALDSLVEHLASSPDLTGFLMRFHHCASEPPTNRALVSALTIALGYFLGGFVPLLPYFFVDHVLLGLYISVGVMALALFAFGYTKTCVVTGWRGSRRVLLGVYGGVQMVLVGGLAAGAAMGLVMAFDRLSGSGDVHVFGGGAGLLKGGEL